MNATSITLSERQKKRLAVGHNPALETVKNWDIDALAGAGALRSTANDMLKFAAAHLELTGTPLKSAVRRMRTVHRDTGTAGLEIGMGWHIVKRHGTEIVWHNGATAGYTSFLGIDPSKKRAVIVLCNTALNNDDAGLHFLEGRFPVAKFPSANP